LNRGHLREARFWLQWALERTPNDDSLRRGIALAGLSLVLWSQNDIDRAAPAANRARAIANESGDAELLALAVHMQGLIEMTQGNREQAERLMGEALAVQRAIGTRGYGALAKAALATIALRRGNEAACAQQAGEALAMFRAIGHASGAAVALGTLAELATHQGDERAAFTAYREALELWVGCGDRLTIVWAFGGLAAAAAAWDQPELAATLIGAIAARLDENGADLWLGDRRIYERAAEAARATLGEEHFTMLVSSGRELPYAAAVAAAAAVTMPVPADGPLGSDPIVSTVIPAPSVSASCSARR
jgi:ATP/maltotriose-dependent transcriptional regulator MalT